MRCIMSNYSNAIILLKNLADKKSISANDLLNLLIRTIEGTEEINGDDVSKSKIDDTIKFADDISYLLEKLVDTIKNNESALDVLSESLRTQFDEDHQLLCEKSEELKETHEIIQKYNKQKRRIK